VLCRDDRSVRFQAEKVDELTRTVEELTADVLKLEVEKQNLIAALEHAEKTENDKAKIYENQIEVCTVS